MLAILLRCSEDSFLARALPPLRPPLRPMAERYAVTASFGLAGSWVDKRTISAASWLESFGSFLLERLMHQSVNACGRIRQSHLTLRMRHYRNKEMLSTQSRNVRVFAR